MMIRHVKRGIPEIPTPIWEDVHLRMSGLEETTYNALVSLVSWSSTMASSMTHNE